MSKKKMAVRRVAATTALGVGLVAGGAGLASATSTQSCAVRVSFFVQFAERIREHFENAPPIIFEALPQDDPKQRCPDISKAKRILGWEPKVGLKDGLEVTMAYFKEQFAKKSAG